MWLWQDLRLHGSPSSGLLYHHNSQLSHHYHDNHDNNNEDNDKYNNKYMQLFDIAGGGPETDAFKHLAAAFSVLR